MTPHTHGLHAMRATSPDYQSMRMAMLSQDPPAKRLKLAAETLNAQLLEGEFNRLNDTKKTELFALVWLMDAAADEIAARPAPPPRVARKWWRFWE